jgi:serine/threonine protein kinase
MPKALSELLSEGTLEDVYTVTKHLGAGAFSEVKLATRRSDGKSCAVKIMKRDHPEFNEVRVGTLPSAILLGTDTLTGAFRSCWCWR